MLLVLFVLVLVSLLLFDVIFLLFVVLCSRLLSFVVFLLFVLLSLFVGVIFFSCGLTVRHSRSLAQDLCGVKLIDRRRILEENVRVLC